MGTTAEKLTYLNETKTQLKDMLNLGGASLTTEPFRQYVDTLKNRYLYFINNGTDVVWNNWDKVTGEGTIITLDNTEEAPMKIVLKGNTSQEGTPTPESPQYIHVVSGDNSIVVCGKNLAYTGWAEDCVARINNNNVARLETKDNKNCLCYTANAGYGDYDNKYLFKTNWKENTRYTIKCSILNDSSQIVNNYNMQIYYTDGTTAPIFLSNQQNAWISFSYTSAPNKTIKYITSAYYAGIRYLDLDTFMVYEGNQDTTYEPYQSATYPINLGDIELCKIGDYQDSIKKSTGKNLFDKNNINGLNAYLDTTNNKLVSNNNNKSIYISCKPNTTYTISKTPSKRFGVAYTYTTPENNTAIYGTITNYDGASITITTDTNAQYLVVWLINSNISGEISYQTAIDTLQIELGNQATPYEPYGTSWYLNKQIGKVVLDGSEEWKIGGTYSGITQFDVNANTTNIPETILKVLSNYFRGVVWKNSWTINKCISIGLNIIRIMTSDYTTVADFKAWLSEHNTEVYYVLATPTYTEITDSTLISQLNDLWENTISYKAQTNITQTNNDLPFIINATALREME